VKIGNFDIVLSSVWGQRIT